MILKIIKSMSMLNSSEDKNYFNKKSITSKIDSQINSISNYTKLINGQFSISKSNSKNIISFYSLFFY